MSAWMSARACAAQFLPQPAHFRATLRLALPVVVVQVGLMLFGVVDTIMVGHISGASLAAVGLGNFYFFVVTVLGMGTLMAIDPVASQAVGARDREGIALAVQRGLLLTVGLSIPLSALLWPCDAAFRLLAQQSDVIPLATTYVRVSIPGVMPFLGFVVFRQSLQALHRLRPIVFTIAVANLLNVLFNWILIFGHLGFPPLGVAGAAWATTISRWIMAILLLWFSWSDLGPQIVPFRRKALERAPLWRMFQVGAPIGLQYFLEVGAFSLVGIVIGWLGTSQQAGHNIALNLASLTFMVPLGVSAAAAVLVGQAIGRGDPVGARRFAGAALVCGAAFMTLAAVIFLSIPRLLARCYTHDPAVIEIAAALIPIAGVFQPFDGLQVVSGGILRGAGDTRAPVVVNLAGFWAFGVPVSIYLGFWTDLGALGLWWGFVAGLGAVAAFLIVRIAFRLSGEISRLVIDERKIDS